MITQQEIEQAKNQAADTIKYDCEHVVAVLRTPKGINCINVGGSNSLDLIRMVIVLDDVIQQLRKTLSDNIPEDKLQELFDEQNSKRNKKVVDDRTETHQLDPEDISALERLQKGGDLFEQFKESLRKRNEEDN